MKVLILEDDDLVAEGLVRCLGYLGHEGEHVRQLAQARSRMLASPDIEVALIDIELENGECGEEFLHWLARDRPSVTRILISGLNRPKGFVDDLPRQLFLHKPFGLVELTSVFAALHRSAARLVELS